METDVIIAGAGPTGVTPAAEPRLGGVGVAVTGRPAEPPGRPLGAGLTAPVMGTFGRRGLLPRFRTRVKSTPDTASAP
ncbi:FAD-dependent monooxygenase [Streptomyces sp. NPDC088762]|uniref:FAD-dependent monooxygenase n=1 Tax=Streptomyces sp. NPDC088762 TaxID=3365891 RepID=UPI0037F8A96A